MRFGTWSRQRRQPKREWLALMVLVLVLVVLVLVLLVLVAVRVLVALVSVAAPCLAVRKDWKGLKGRSLRCVSGPWSFPVTC